MTRLFSSVLVPLDGSSIAARSLGCVRWLASRLASRLHILSATTRDLPAREELTRLKVPEEYWPLVTLHQAAANAPDAILEATKRHEVQLVVMTSLGETAEAPAAAPSEMSPLKVVGNVARAIIEQCAAPVLLLPPNYREALPWERILTPLSGETEVDEALDLAVHLAHALKMEVHVAHVTGEGDENISARAHYADAMHLEYPGQLEELVRRGMTRCSPEECQHIVDVALCCGDIVAELLSLIESKRISLIVVGWHGHFRAGRARVLTELLQTVKNPILLVKPERRSKLRLKVGEEFE